MTEHEIRNCLSTSVFGRKIYAFETIDSTNTFARSLISNGGQEGTLVVSEEQTAGHGRFGRPWISERGKSLTFSVLLRPSIPADRLGILSLLAALAVARAIHELTSLRPDCKWPNDVLLNGKKVCGILSEGTSTGNSLSGVVVGIGLNVNQSVFPAEIQETATSLLSEAGGPVDRIRLLGLVMHHLELCYRHIQSRDTGRIIALWQEWSTMIGKPVSVSRDGESIQGIAGALHQDGSLLLRTNGNELKILAGDVTVIS